MLKESVETLGRDKGAGVIVTVYMYPLREGGVHSIVTVELKLPFIVPTTLTSLGAAPAKQQNIPTDINFMHACALAMSMHTKHMRKQENNKIKCASWHGF